MITQSQSNDRSSRLLPNKSRIGTTPDPSLHVKGLVCQTSNCPHQSKIKSLLTLIWWCLVFRVQCMCVLIDLMPQNGRGFLELCFVHGTYVNGGGRALTLHDHLNLPRPLHWPGRGLPVCSVSGGPRWNGGHNLAGGEAISVWKVVDCVEVDLLHPQSWSNEHHGTSLLKQPSFLWFTMQSRMVRLWNQIQSPTTTNSCQANCRGVVKLKGHTQLEHTTIHVT